MLTQFIPFKNGFSRLILINRSLRVPYTLPKVQKVPPFEPWGGRR
jgi:hypothetical protein